MSILDDLKMINCLTKEERIEFETFCQERFLCKGEVLFNEGDEAESMYFLKTGSIAVDKVIDGRKTNIGKVHAEGILGEMALFGNTGKRMASSVAIEDCVLITVLSFSIKKLAKENSNLFGKIHKIIEDRVIDNKILENKIRESM